MGFLQDPRNSEFFALEIIIPGIRDVFHSRDFKFFPGIFITGIYAKSNMNFSSLFLTREASIQLVYQLCVVIQQFLYFPVKDLTSKPIIYAQSNGASIQWILGLIFQVLSILASAFSAINLPLMV